MNSVSDEKIVDKIIKKVGGSSLIAILQELQFHYNYLPEQVLGLLSKKLEVPLSKIFSLTTFYQSFSLKPRGKNLVKVCLGDEDMTTKDLGFTVEKVRCLGCCSLAPVVLINKDTYGSMTQEKMSKVLKKYI